MTDETKSGDQPESKELDLDALVERINADNEKRFRGFQSLLDQRDAKFEAALEDLRNSDLTPEEQEEAKSAKLNREIEELRRRNEILSKRKDFPEETDLLEQFLEAGSLEDQLRLLSQFRKAQKPEVPESNQDEAAEGGEPTPVDKNNPPRKGQPEFGAQMTKELSDQIMRTSGQDKGILSRLRRTG